MSMPVRDRLNVLRGHLLAPAVHRQADVERRSNIIHAATAGNADVATVTTAELVASALRELDASELL